jgi:hypothetical protein
MTTELPARTGRPPGVAVLSSDELAEIGAALYGHQWQTPLARDLDISDRSLRYLADGSRPVHEGIARDLAQLLAARSGALDKLADRVLAKLDAAGLT